MQGRSYLYIYWLELLSCLIHSPKPFSREKDFKQRSAEAVVLVVFPPPWGLCQRGGTQSESWENHLSASSNTALLGKPGQEPNAPKPGYLEDPREATASAQSSLWLPRKLFANKPSSLPPQPKTNSLQTYLVQHPVILTSCFLWSSCCIFCSACWKSGELWQW